MLKKVALGMAILAVGLFGSGLLLMGCPKDSGGDPCQIDEDCPAGQYCANDGKCHDRVDPDGGDGEDGADLDGGDAPADEGPQPCQNDQDCPADKVCDVNSGDCIDGTGCSADYNCDINTEYCDPDGKVCKQRAQLCDPCSGDYQCPDPGEGDMCITYPNGQSFCGQACGNRGCPPGYLCDQDYGSGSGPNPNQCRSNTFDCEGTFICHSDADCAANQVCNMAQGTCVNKCIDDTSCASGLKCHYTGHCAPPCATDADCEGDMICCTPGRGYCDANSTGKCRPEGCVLHSECLLAQGDSLGYCDKATHTCKTGCRAADPQTVNDCKSGMKCTCTGASASCDSFDCCGDPGQPCLCDPALQDCSNVDVCVDGLCEEIPCHERGDVSIACARSQVCCGWPLDDGYSCPGASTEGECYVAPMEVWCSACGSEGDACDVAGYGYGEPGICLSDSSDGNTYCHLACRDTQDCPSTWQCDYSYLRGCEQDSDCEAGSTCGTFLKRFDDQGQVEELLACMCTDTSHCGELNGFAGSCEPAQLCDQTLDPTQCVEGMVCKYAKACQCSNCCSQLAQGG